MSNKLGSWINVYIPKTVEELTSNKRAINTFYGWLKTFDKNKKEFVKDNDSTQKKRKNKKTSKQEGKYSSVIVTGKHGTGKTTSVEVILRHFGYEIITLNFTELKNRKKENSNIINKLLESNDVLDIMKVKEKKKSAILVDELESITSTSEKAVLLELQKENDLNWYCPIVFISNNKHNKILSEFKKQCIEIRFFPPYESEMRNLLVKIAKKEKIKITSESIVSKIIEHAQGDFRRLIITLQDIKYAYDKKKITSDVLDEYFKHSKKKDIDFDLYNTTDLLLSKFDSIDECLRLYEVEKTLLPLMMHENYPDFVMKNYKSSAERFDIMEKISESLSDGDVVENCIYGDQNWDMQEIHGLLSCVLVSYNLCKTNDNPIKSKCNFTTDLNKTSIKKINSKNIINADKCFKNVDIFDYIYMNKIIRKKIEDGKIDECVQLLSDYNIKLEHIETLLKIDKIKDSKNNLTSKQKKEFLKYLG